MKLTFNIVFTVIQDEIVKVLGWKLGLQEETEYSLPEPLPGAELCLHAGGTELGQSVRPV